MCELLQKRYYELDAQLFVIYIRIHLCVESERF